MQYVVGHIKPGAEPLVRMQMLDDNDVATSDIVDRDIFEVNGVLMSDEKGRVIYMPNDDVPAFGADEKKGSKSKDNGKDK